MSTKTSGRPAFDPWLSHLRRDRRGLPVPYINIWGQETVDRLRVAYDPHARGRAVFYDDADQTVPDFTKQHMARQRECVAMGLCQVCARHVPWSRRNLVVAALSVQWVRLDGVDRREVPVIFEPWLDDRCAEIATRWCPALIRRTREERLTVVPVRSQRDVRLVLSTGWLEGPLEAETKADPVGMWLKIALLKPNITRAAPVPVGT